LNVVGDFQDTAHWQEPPTQLALLAQSLGPAHEVRHMPVVELQA